MSESDKVVTNTRLKLEHVALSMSSSQKVDAWLEQVSTKRKGVKISRKDFVNWLIEKSPDNLSGGDLSALIERFYDEAAFLRQLLRDVKQAKANGKTESGFELVLKTKKTEVRRDASDSQLSNETILEASDEE